MSLTKASYSMINGAPINVIDYGADPTGSTDSTSAIQAAITYACSLVTNAATGDPVNGATVVFQGVFKITVPLYVSAGNVVLDGQGGTTIYPYYTSKTINSITYNGAPPVFVIGTAAGWQGTGSISNTYKYNRINGFLIKLPSGSGYIGAIGILASGTRNASVTNIEIENQYCGIYLENTSEFVGEQIASFGCTYGFISDSRYNRTALQSPLNLTCTTNDVSSTSYYMCTAYYPQSSGVMLLDVGTHNFSGMTIGQFSTNIDTSGSLGFPSVGAGIFINGGSTNSNLTRGSLFSDFVFEANGTINSDCIFINQTTAYQAIQGVTFQNCVVQTYAPVGGSVSTTFIAAQTITPGLISNVVCRDSGFVYQTSGYFYGQMANNTVISGSVGVRFENCYPLVAFSNSILSVNDTISNRTIIDTPTLTTFPPSGWTSSGTVSGCSSQGGSSGVAATLQFTGSGSAMSIYKNYTFREFAPLAAPYIEFVYNGTGTPQLLVYAIVNGVSATQSNNGSSDQIPRYSNAIYYPTTVNSYSNRLVWTFEPFSANYPFDNVTFHIGSTPSASGDVLNIGNITVGYFNGQQVPYNPF